MNTEKLFSYGTLRYEKVQITTFGRILKGYAATLPGYALKTIQITDPDVIATSGESVHSIIEYSGDPTDQIKGIVFEVSPEELLQADSYEVADYKRIQVVLYPNKLKNWQFGGAKAPGIDDCKFPHISNIGELTIVDPRELSHGPNANSSACLGISSGTLAWVYVRVS